MNRFISISLAAVLMMASSAQALAQQAPAGAQQQAAQASPLDVDPNSMVMAAMQAAQLVDAGRAAEMWEGGSAVAKQAVKKDAFVQQITTARAPLGQPVSRAWLSVIRQSIQPSQASAGSPPGGDYVSVRFATRFSSGRTVAELVTFRLEENGTWRVAGYAIQ